MEWVEALSFLPTILVVGSVLTQSKNVSALAQLGSVASRSDDIDGIFTDDAEKKKVMDEEAEKIKDIDKLTFTVSAFNIGMTCYWLGKWPETFYLWHIPKVLILTSVRFYLFKGEGKHYLLYDFCYWANGLSIYYTLFCPADPICFQVLFVVANGPLSWSILAFQQSLVLHSLQHMISVFIHSSPMILTLALRWQRPCAGMTSRFATTTPWDVSDSILSMTVRGVLYFYLPWVLLYYLWVFVYLGEHVRRKGYQTLFDRVTGMTLGKRLASVKDNTRNQLLRKAVYLVCHLAFGTITMAFAAAMYHCETAHFAFALSILSASAWNGATFYSKVWAQKYMLQVETAALLRAEERLAVKNSPRKQRDRSPPPHAANKKR